MAGECCRSPLFQDLERYRLTSPGSPLRQFLRCSTRALIASLLGSWRPVVAWAALARGDSLAVLPAHRIAAPPLVAAAVDAAVPAPAGRRARALAYTRIAASGPDATRVHAFAPGWNLVTVPLLPFDAFPSVVFGDVSPLFLFDDVRGETLAVGESGFRDVVPGRGFRLLVGDQAPSPLVSVSGTPVSFWTKRLTVTWS